MNTESVTSQLYSVTNLAMTSMCIDRVTVLRARSGRQEGGLPCFAPLSSPRSRYSSPSRVATARTTTEAPSGPEGNEVRGGTIDSPEAAQQFFEAVMPSLIAVFTDVADQLAGSFASEADKQMGEVASAQCPDGGSVEINLFSGMTNVTDCAADGAVLNGTLFVFVSPPFEDSFTGDTFYSASFSGPLEVSGAYQGAINIDSGFADWTDPFRVESTFWSVSASIGGELVYLSSEGSTFEPEPFRRRHDPIWRNLQLRRRKRDLRHPVPRHLSGRGDRANLALRHLERLRVQLRDLRLTAAQNGYACRTSSAIVMKYRMASGVSSGRSPTSPPP